MNVGPGLPSRLPQSSLNPILVPAYSIIVAGPPSVGKSSLLRLLLDTAPVSPHATQPQLDSVARFLRSSSDILFPECELQVLWNGERVLLRLIECPSLDFTTGAEEDLDRALRDIVHFVESRYIEGAREESTVGESHVHLCLYVLDPSTINPRPYSYHRRPSPSSPPPSASSHTSLPPAEITAIRRLSNRVNVLPVLGRTDGVSLTHLADLKRSVRRDLADAGLGFGIFDDEATAPCAAPAADIPLPLLPFALFAPETFLPQMPGPSALDDDDSARLASLNGRFTRRFRAGVLDALDPRHSDFVALRRATMMHHKVLKKYTKDYLYEKFKVDSLLAAQNHRQGRVHPGSVHALLNHRDEREPPEHEYVRPAGASSRTALSPLHQHPTRLPPVSYDRDDGQRESLHQRERDREREREREEAPRDTIIHEENSQGRKRKITMACNFCRSRKLKCDGIRPACAQCVKRGNTCDYQSHAPNHGGHGNSWKYKRTIGAPVHGQGHGYANAPSGLMEEGRPHEDVDELDEEVSSASESYGGAGAQQTRKRVSVDMLIAATLDHPAASAPPPPPPAAPWYDAAGGGSGMGVLDVGSEGDKKKRLNRQSANYGSKAVACVHCRARKTRCDAARPACGNCVRRGLGCSYVHTQPSQPRSKGKKGNAAAAAAASSSSMKTESAPTTPPPPPPPPYTHMHGHTHGNLHGPMRSPPAGNAWHSPVPVDSALEESAERDRPRSPVAPPIATLDGSKGGGGMNGNGNGMHSPDGQRRSSTPAGPGTGTMIGGKRSGAEAGVGVSEAPGKRAKWGATPEGGMGIVSVPVVPEGVRV